MKQNKSQIKIPDNTSRCVTVYRDRSKSNNNLKCDYTHINLNTSTNEVYNKLHHELITMKIL